MYYKRRGKIRSGGENSAFLKEKLSVISLRFTVRRYRCRIRGVSVESLLVFRSSGLQLRDTSLFDLPIYQSANLFLEGRR